MADQQIGNKDGVVNAATNTGTQRSNMGQNNDDRNNPQNNTDYDNADTISTMRARLAIIDATFYTSARLNTMTLNDMVYAIRVSDYPAAIKQ